MSLSQTRIEHATDMDQVRCLFREYQVFLDVELCFQDFERELAGLPGKYAQPRGVLYFGFVDEALAGCIGMRPLGDDICEMKRLYVRPEFRGTGLGRRLAESCLETAKTAGYRIMRLDTLARLEAAVALYRSMGFIPTGAYYDNPLDGVSYWEKSL